MMFGRAHRRIAQLELQGAELDALVQHQLPTMRECQEEMSHVAVRLQGDRRKLPSISRRVMGKITQTQPQALAAVCAD